jgi:hypothetical protein
MDRLSRQNVRVNSSKTIKKIENAQVYDSNHNDHVSFGNYLISKNVSGRMDFN